MKDKLSYHLSQRTGVEGGGGGGCNRPFFCQNISTMALSIQLVWGNISKIRHNSYSCLDPFFYVQKMSDNVQI